MNRSRISGTSLDVRILGPDPLGRIALVQIRGDALVGRHVAVLADVHEEPQLVLLDRPAEADVEVGDQVHAVAVDESARAQFVGDVVRLPLPGTAAGEERPAEPVAPLPRNHVDPDAAGRDVGAGAARLVRHFGVRGVAEIRLHFAVVHQAVD